VVFAYAANPPAPEIPAGAATPLTPTAGLISLTAVGREALRDTLGSVCINLRPKAVAIGGTTSAPDVVTVGGDGCKVARFVLSAQWGSWKRQASAPTR
jgi:hypothetical protein